MTTTQHHELAFPVESRTRLSLQADDATVHVQHLDTDQIRVCLHCAEPFDAGLVTTSSADGSVRITIPALAAPETGSGLALHWGRLKAALGMGMRLQIDVQAPAGTDLDLVVNGGDINVTGGSGEVSVHTGGGDVSVERAELLRLKTAGGDLHVGTAGDTELSTSGGDIVADRLGPSRVRTSGGDIRIEYLAEGRISTSGGDIHVGHADGPVDAQAGGGDISLGHCTGETSVRTGAGDIHADVAEGSLTVRTGAGDVTVVVPAGVPVWRDLDSALGEVHSRIDTRGEPVDGQPFIRVTARTGTGDVVLTS